MAKIDIKDIDEQESELFIEDLGKVCGGSQQDGITTLAIGEEDSSGNPPDLSFPQMPNVEQVVSDALSKIPDCKGIHGGVTTYAAFGEE